MLDVFGKNTDILKSKKLFLFDMDGTIYNENKLFDNVLELFNYLSQKNYNYVFLTNNSSKSVNDYVKKINKLGITATKNNFFTSSQATILYIKQNYPNKKVYCLGTKSFIQELKEAKINVTDHEENDIAVIVVGFDTELTSDKLKLTCKLLYKNIPFIATNPDLACPVSFGFIPDCGSICQMLTNATGKTPFFIGKPKPIMVKEVLKKYNCRLEDTIIIGDRLCTDIATGINTGVDSICVLTGESTIESIIKSNIKPTFVLKSVSDLYKIIKS